MKACLIAPPNLLWAVERKRNHMALAPLCDVEWYYNFYEKKSRSPNDFVILDNGAYEGRQKSWEAYWSLVRSMRPTVYVLPEVVGDGAETRRYAREFPRAEGSIRMVTIQLTPGEDPFEEFDKYAALGLPLAMPKSWGAKRAPYARTLSMVYSNPLHAFGMLDGDPSEALQELRTLHSLGVSSLDSSRPVWMAAQGRRLGEVKPESNPGFHKSMLEDPNFLLDIDENLLNDNILAFERACQGE